MLLLILCFTVPIHASDLTENAGTEKLYQSSSKKPGWHTGKQGKKYFLKKDGKRAVGWKRIKGKYYYFNNGGVLTGKTGWIDLNGKRMYIQPDRSRCQGGMYEIGGNLYYFNKAGALVTNREKFVVSGKYYSIGADGTAKEIPLIQIQCGEEAQKFIEKHTSASQTNYQKLRKCFDWLLAYMGYVGGSSSRSQFYEENWQYKKAVSVFQTMCGNCYSFACAVAACAKELGYEPTVIIVDGHGYVRINGGYYDNMHGGLFGSPYPVVSESKAFLKVTF